MRISRSVSEDTATSAFLPRIPRHLPDVSPAEHGMPRGHLDRKRGEHVRSRVVTKPNCLTFLTDFGLEDGFVAACHGVAARIAPAARVIDITHLVPPGDVRRGAAVLAQTVPAMPPAVHVAVVDPGVGTTRRAVAIEAKGGILVGPDNGLLSWAIGPLGGATRAVLLTNQKLWNHPVSPTFHGRDIFMPVASHLATGTSMTEAGTEVDLSELVMLAK